MTLDPEIVSAAEKIAKILDGLQFTHDGRAVIWLAQAMAAYAVASDGEILIASSAGQHVRMRRAASAYLEGCGAHDVAEVLAEIALVTD